MGEVVFRVKPSPKFQKKFVAFWLRFCGHTVCGSQPPFSSGVMLNAATGRRSKITVRVLTPVQPLALVAVMVTV
ncbi:MAG: hypothetical protein U0176_07485 [Bacteroidia bacterium]